MRVNSTKETLNFYDYILILIIGLLAFGIIGGAFTPIRIVGIILFPAAIKNAKKIISNSNYKYIIYYVLFIILYVHTSILWSNNQTQGMKEAIYLIIHSAIFLEIIIFSSKSFRPLFSICFGWFIAVIATLPIAIREILTDQHLSLSNEGSGTLANYGEGLIVQKVFASATFGNYNGYVTFLGYALPFLFSLLFLTRSYKSLFILLSAISCSAAIILINASRGGIITFFLTMIIFLFHFKKINSYNRKIINLTAIPILFIIVYFGYDFLTFQLLARLDSVTLVSDQSREDLIGIGLLLLLETYFFGVGAGDLVSSYSKFGSDIQIPHNIFMELLVQYGILILLIFIQAIVKFFRVGNKSNDCMARFSIRSGFLILPVIGVVNSGYWLSPTTWCFIASLFAIAASKSSTTDTKVSEEIVTFERTGTRYGQRTI